MKNHYVILAGIGLSLLVPQVYASEASEYCSDLYPADSYEPAERSEYIQECLKSYAGHDDGFSNDASSDNENAEEGSFNGGINDFMGTVDSSE